MMNPQGLPSGPGASAGPGGEMTPSTQPTMPMSNFNQGQPIAQGYRGPVMPGQGPTISSMLLSSLNLLTEIFFILNLNLFQICNYILLIKILLKKLIKILK